MSPFRLNYLNIGNDETEMRERMFQDRYSVWHELFPLPPWRRGKDDAEEADYNNRMNVNVTERIDEEN